MLKRNLFLLLLASFFVAPAANAEVKLIAIGSLSGNISDLSKKPSAPLENGVRETSLVVWVRNSLHWL